MVSGDQNGMNCESGYTNGKGKLMYAQMLVITNLLVCDDFAADGLTSKIRNNALAKGAIEEMKVTFVRGLDSSLLWSSF